MWYLPAKHTHTALLPIFHVQCDLKSKRSDLVDAETHREPVTELKSSTRSPDPVPTPRFKTIFNSVSEDTLSIVNDSLQLGFFPTDFKTALFKMPSKKREPGYFKHWATAARFWIPLSSNILENILEALKPLHWLPVRYVLNLKWLY